MKTATTCNECMDGYNPDVSRTICNENPFTG